MAYYQTDKNTIPKLELMLEAEMMNLQTERAVLVTLRDFNYSGNVFNKRYATQLHKYLGEKFGTKELDEPNYKGETSYNLVNVGMHDSASYDGIKRYELGVYFSGFTVRYNSDEKAYKIERKNESFTLYSITNADQVTEQAISRLEGIQKSLNSIQTASEDLPLIIKQHDSLVEQINTHNKTVPYIISDELRIK